MIPRLLTALLLLPAVSSSQRIESLRTYQVQYQEFAAALDGRSTLPLKCGLYYTTGFERAKPDLSPELLQKMQHAFQRPQHLTEFYVSPGGHFRIHYTLQGEDAVDPTSTNNAGVPDYVFEAARAAERSYRLLVDSLGFRPHLDDNGTHGPEYDIYILDLGNVYGWTYSENQVSENPARYNTYMEVDNDYIGNYFTKGIDALRVTVAHEYFHAIQFAYAYRASDIFFFEMSATWFEDLAYDDVNDYLQYLPNFFRKLDRPLHLRDNWHEYGASLWLKYWLQDRDYRSLRRIWEMMTDRPALLAIRDEVENQGILFPDALAEFYSWCLYTNARYVPGQYFEEGDLYPEITIPPYRQITVQKDTALVDSSRALTAVFYQVATDPSKDFSAILTSELNSQWRILAAAESLNGQLGRTLSRQGPVPVTMREFENEGKIYLAAVNARMPDDPEMKAVFLPQNPFEISISLKDLGSYVGVLLPPQPNPFIADGEQTVSFLFNLEQTAPVRITIVSERGREVFTRQIDLKPRGLNQFVWDGKSNDGQIVSSGIYVVILKSGEGESGLQKLAVIRR